MTPADKKIAARALGQRLRRRRIEVGLTQSRAAKLAGTTEAVWKLWEVGKYTYPILEVPAIAAALGIPIASLLIDDLVLAEIRVSDETLNRVKREGRPAAIAAGERLAGGVAELLFAEATRPPVDLSPGARAKPRRSREQVLIESKARLAAHKAAIAA